MTTIPELVREYYNGDPGTLPPFKTRLLDCCRVHNIVGYLWNQSKLARCLCRLHNIFVYLWNQSKLAGCLSIDRTTLLVTCGISLNWLAVSL